MLCILEIPYYNNAIYFFCNNIYITITRKLNPQKCRKNEKTRNRKIVSSFPIIIILCEMRAIVIICYKSAKKNKNYEINLNSSTKINYYRLLLNM